MNITLQQAKGFVDVLLGDRFVGDDATKANSPLVRAFLKGVMPNGCPSDYAVNGANRPFATAKITIERDHFCDFLEAVAYRLRHPKEEYEQPASTAAKDKELETLRRFKESCAAAWRIWCEIDPTRDVDCNRHTREFISDIRRAFENLNTDTSD